MADFESMSDAGRAAYERAMRRSRNANAALPSKPQLRAENEDDDGYDPYSDYMDALSRSAPELFEEDPWR